MGRRFPLVVELLERRTIHLSAVHLLRRFLTEENHEELLAEACHKSKRQVEALLARRYPREDVATNLRKLPNLEPLSPGRYRLELTIDEADKQELELACDLLSGIESRADAVSVFRRGVRLVVDEAKKRRFGKQSSRRLPGAAPVTATPVATEPVAPKPASTATSTVLAQPAVPEAVAARRPAATRQRATVSHVK